MISSLFGPCSLGTSPTAVPQGGGGGGGLAVSETSYEGQQLAWAVCGCMSGNSTGRHKCGEKNLQRRRMLSEMQKTQTKLKTATQQQQKKMRKQKTTTQQKKKQGFPYRLANG